MIRNLLVVACLMLHIGHAHAQTPTVQYSNTFEEPHYGWTKLLQLKSGQTFFFHLDDEGIEARIYANAKPIGRKVIKGKTWTEKKVPQTKIVGLYEINGQPVIFIQQFLEWTPKLFRVVLDANTGAVVSEEQIGQQKKMNVGSGYAMGFGGVDEPGFYVEKDPASDNYAVVNYNSFAKESKERIEVIHYTVQNGTHTQANKSFYDADQFKYLRYIGAVVVNNTVYACVYGYNTAASGGKDSRVILSKLAAGNDKFTHKMLEFTDDFKETEAIMQYNPGSRMIQLLTLTLVKSKHSVVGYKSKNYYMALMSLVDPETLTIISSKDLNTPKASEYAVQKLGVDGFSGMPQRIAINSDNTTTLLSEGLHQATTSRGGSYTTFGNIGISDLDNRCSETDGYAIRKEQTAEHSIDAFFGDRKAKGIWRFGLPLMMPWRNKGLENGGYFSFDYLTTPGARYVILNDYPENFDKEQNSKKWKDVNYVSESNTIFYKIENGNVSKEYLFGKPTENNKYKFSYIASSDYQPATNTYATLIVQRDGKEKLARIAWVKF